jgi:hypothetical protein
MSSVPPIEVQGPDAGGLDDVVLCARGLRIAQRGAAAPDDTMTWRVSGGAAVTLPGTPPAEAMRSDGVVWRRHWLSPERLVIEFVDVAVVDVDGATRKIVFDRHLSDDVEQHLLFDHVVPLVLARDGALVLHGGVISRHGDGVVLVGSSGAGKSTLTAFAWRLGWTVGGDDGAVLTAGDPPTVEPTYPTVRLTGESLELLGIDPASCSAVARKMRLSSAGGEPFSQQPVRLRFVAIVEPTAEGNAARFDRLGGIDAHAELFGSTFHADLSGIRLLPQVVDQLASIVETSVVGRLTVPRGINGLASAEALLRALVAPGGVA